MIRVSVRRNESGDVTAFRIQGHAGFALRGQDIVCAGASVLAQTTLIGLQQRLAQPLRARQADGLLECYLEPAAAPQWLRAQDLIETMLLGLKELSNQFPNAVQVRDGR